MRLYNTLTRHLDEFKPMALGRVGVYSCGPTVYWNQHIGHMYAYVHWDVLVRFLRYLSFEVKWVMNVTDVGHMTSDEDAGEDKMEKGAKREGVSVWDVANKYIGQFIDSLELLNVHRPDVLCRATEHIAEQIGLIKKIEANGFTYRTGTGIVFDTSKFPGYSAFAKLDLEKQKSGARVEIDAEKKQPWDFLLWITNQPAHLMQWESPWGRGFPGWHIECTAMSTKYLGETFDIHTGGKEHIPVHHTDEIAQAFGAFKHVTANYWLHNEWLTVSGEKMSKSLGNFYTVQDLIAKGYDPLALRYLILTSNYRTGLNFSWESLTAAKTALLRLRKSSQAIKAAGDRKNRGIGCADYEQRFAAALAEDINSPKALAVVWDLVNDPDLPSGAKTASLERFDSVLGLKLMDGASALEVFDSTKVSDSVGLLLKERQTAREAKDFPLADELRRKIEAEGYRVEDTEEGQQLRAGA
ncbi:MAG: cysteine--tRNA ligase [Patescibacteria group bacterium]